MLIESIIQRAKGTTVDMDGVSYRFLPSAAHDGRHVAEVEDQRHISRFLAIREGFRPADESFAPMTSGVVQEIDGFYFLMRGPQDIKALAHWAASIPEMIEPNPALEDTLLIDKIAMGDASLGGYSLAPDPIPDMQPTSPSASIPPTPEPSLSASADNSIMPTDHSQPEASRVAGPADSAAGDGGGDVGGVAADTVTEDRETLAVRYADRFGHRPNGRWNAEKIAAALAEEE